MCLWYWLMVWPPVFRAVEGGVYSMKRKRWRPGLVEQILYFSLGVGFLFLAALSIWMHEGDVAVEDAIPSLIFGGAGSAFLAHALLSHITLDEYRVTVGNLGITRSFAIDAVEDVEACYSGIVFRYAGRRSVALAVQKPNVLAALGRHTRADTVAEAIRSAIRSTQG